MQKYTRHHILYPHRLWQRSYSGDDKKRAAFLRGKFIIKLPEELHAELHQHVDAMLPQIVIAAHAPSPATVTKIYLICRKIEDEIDALTAIEKIEWLIERFDPADQTNESVLLCLSAQLDFLKAHEVEY